MEVATTVDVPDQILTSRRRQTYFVHKTKTPAALSQPVKLMNALMQLNKDKHHHLLTESYFWSLTPGTKGLRGAEVLLRMRSSAVDD